MSDEMSRLKTLCLGIIIGIVLTVEAWGTYLWLVDRLNTAQAWAWRVSLATMLIICVLSLFRISTAERRGKNGA